MSATEDPFRKKLRTTCSLEMSNHNFEDLPNEILSKILDYLNIRDLIRCGQTFRRLRFVVRNELLWKKVNLSNKSLVPVGLLKLILERGCEHLNVSDQIVGNLYINQFTKLKRLNLSWKYAINDRAQFSRNAEVLVKLLCNSNLLEKLELYGVNLDRLSLDMCIWNIKTVKVLRLSYCNRGYETELCFKRMHRLKLNFIRHIVDQCLELEELSFYKTRLEEDSIDYLVKNINPKLSKLSLCTNSGTGTGPEFWTINKDAIVIDNYIQILVRRCNNLTELNLTGSGFTNDSVNFIIEHLRSTLEKLCLIGTRVGVMKLFELKAMKKLAILEFKTIFDLNIKELERFRRNHPHIQLYYAKARSIVAKPNWNSDNLSAFRSYK